MLTNCHTKLFVIFLFTLVLCYLLQNIRYVFVLPMLISIVHHTKQLYNLYCVTVLPYTAFYFIYVLSKCAITHTVTHSVGLIFFHCSLCSKYILLAVQIRKERALGEKR